MRGQKSKDRLPFCPFVRIAERFGSEGKQGSDFLEFSGTLYFCDFSLKVHASFVI
jgi:hypothetical protein